MSVYITLLHEGIDPVVAEKLALGQVDVVKLAEELENAGALKPVQLAIHLVRR